MLRLADGACVRACLVSLRMSCSMGDVIIRTDADGVSLLQLEFDLLCQGVQDLAGGDCGAGDVAVQWGRNLGVD